MGCTNTKVDENGRVELESIKKPLWKSEKPITEADLMVLNIIQLKYTL